MSDTFFGLDYKESSEISEEISTISGSGGGCFPAGTMVKTANGFKPIEKIKANDLIIGYDRYKKLCYGLVIEPLIHESSSIEALLTFVVLFEEDTFLLPPVSNNHALYNAEDNSHKLAEEFKAGESLTDINGVQLEILEILVDTEFNEVEKVYNLIVEECHTYIVYDNNFLRSMRVHNGGGGKDSSAKAVEDPNTLASDAFLNVLEVISEGEIAGVVGGEFGVLINQVPFRKDAQNLNFVDASVQFRNGLPLQTFISGFEEVTGIFTSNTEVTTLSPVTIFTVDAETIAVEVTLNLPQGLNKLDSATGSLKGFEIEYAIKIGTNTVLQNKIVDKSVTAYEFSHRIERPANVTGNWSFTIVRISPDETSSTIRNTLKVSRWTEIQTPEPVPTYPDVALVGLKIPARSVGNQIPVRTYDTMGMLLDIPTNYDPILRTYSGIWDGQFKTEWTDNTSWFLYNLISNERWGLQAFYNFPLLVDKWAFYDAGVFNDELIPDGQGGMEVRYTFNGNIQLRTVAWQLLQAVASNMSAVVTNNSLGEISIIQDRPSLVADRKILTNASVSEGLFTYTSSKSFEKITQINITFNDRLDRYLPSTVVEKNDALIAAHGLNTQDFIAFGIVDEHRARLAAKRMFRAEEFQSEIVSFGLALNVIDYQVGDVVNILDNDFITPDNTIFQAGRIISNVGNILSLDTEVTLVANEVWTFGTNSPDLSSIIELPVSIGSDNKLTEITVPGLPAGDYSLREFYFYKTGTIEPQPFRILSIEETEQGLFTLQAVRFDNDKWDAVELGLTIEPPIFITDKISKLNSVTGIQVLEDNLNDDDIKTNIMRIVWDFNPKHAFYNIIVTRNDGQVTIKQETNNTFADMENILPGAYKIVITATGILGAVTNPTEKLYIYAGGESSLLKPINFRIQGTESGTDEEKLTFNSNNPILVWEFDPDNEFEDSSLLEYLVIIKSKVSVDGNGIPVTLREYRIPYEVDINSENYKGATWTYKYEDIIADHGQADRDISIWIRAIDLTMRKSTPLMVVINNPAPPLPVGIAHWRVHTFYATLIDQDIPDLSDLLISAGLTNDFLPEKDTWVWQIPAEQTFTGATFTEPYIEEHFVRSALADNYNNDQLNWSEVVFLPKDLNPPTNVPQNVTTIEVNKAHGLRDIIVNWDQYIQGDFPAEVIVLLIQNSHDTHPTISSIFTTIPVDLDSPGTFTFIDNFRGDKTRIGVAAGRYAVEGLVISQVNSPVPEALLCEYVPAQLTVGNSTQDGTESFNYWDLLGETKTPLDGSIPQQPDIPVPIPAPDNPFGLPTPFSPVSIQTPYPFCVIDVASGNVSNKPTEIEAPTNLSVEYIITNITLNSPDNLTITNI